MTLLVLIGQGNLHFLVRLRRTVTVATVVSTKVATGSIMKQFIMETY